MSNEFTSQEIISQQCDKNIKRIASLDIFDKDSIEISGCGGFGTIYVGELLSDRKIAAIKEIRKKYVRDNIKILNNEINILKSISEQGCNSNIVCYYNHIDKINYLYIIMEYIDGTNIDDYVLEKCSDYDICIGDPLHELIYNLTYKLLIGLKFIHDNGIVHGDIKPSNIMIRDDESIVYVDFGLSCKNGLVSCENVGAPGTLYYIDPYLIKTRSFEKTNDIWSLGITLLDLLNIHPWKIENEENLKTKAILKYIENNEPITNIVPEFKYTSNSQLIPNGDYTIKMQNIIDVMVVKDVNKRYTIDDILATFY